MTSTPNGAPLRIAHGYGNSPELVNIALEHGVDLIEADVRLRGGRLRLAHDRRLFFWWLLFGHRGKRRPLPIWALIRGRRSPGLGVSALPLDELPAMVNGRSGLFLDLKGPWLADNRRRFIEMLLPTLRALHNVDVRLCGDWPLLDALRGQLPNARLYYSIADRRRWRGFVERLESGELIAGVSLHAGLFDAIRAPYLRENGIEVFCWPVDTAAEARRVTALGAAGIISYDLTLLATIGGATGEGSLEGRR